MVIASNVVVVVGAAEVEVVVGDTVVVVVVPAYIAFLCPITKEHILILQGSRLSGVFKHIVEIIHFISLKKHMPRPSLELSRPGGSL